jgi:peptidoglycan/LPS O-acetylase OafA/YrhL
VSRLTTAVSIGPYRADIDGLRALAVLSVVGYHAFPRSLRGGFTGVDVFFVISGFLISGIIFEDLRRGRFSFARFYARRFRRIFPALIVVLAACLVYGSLALAPDEFRELGKQAAAGAGFSSNILQWLQAGYFDEKATTKPLLHLWSLGVEEQFYIAWPILLVAAYHRGRLFQYLCGGLLLLSFAVNLIETHTSPSAAFYLPLPRFWELLLGALLAYRFRAGAGSTGDTPAASPAGPGRGGWRTAAGLALIGAGFIWIDGERAFPGWWALLPTLGTTLVISAPQARLNRTLLAAKPLVFIGLISYPLYLWHWVLLTFARIANFGEEPPRAWRIAAIAASGVLAWLTYRWVEKPIRFSGHRDAIPRTLVASMALCGLAGAVVYLTDGFAFRYPPEIRALAAFHYDDERDFYEQSYRGGACLLSAKDTFADLSRRCVDPGSAGRLVALWGDSHAASLYPGLHAAQQRSAFRIAQFTSSACPPVIGLKSERRRNCAAFNDSVIHEFGRLKPDVIILEAHWALYGGANGWPEFDAAALHRTIQALENLGVRQIVVMGSLPTWKIYQPRVAFEIWRHGHVLQDRTAEFLDAEPFAADRIARAAVAGTSAVFISPLELLCREGRCLISTDPHAATPLAWDNDHLSLAGSAFVADRAFKSILGALEPAT